MRWKALSLTALVILTLTSFSSYSQDKGLGLGIILGEPTGISGKYWLDNNRAIDAGLAYSFAHPNKTFSIHADYLFHNETLIRSSLRIPVYYGIGARLHAGNSGGNTLGARGVIGIVWILENTPFDMFMELAPVFNLFPETSLHIDLAVGGRYYFK